MEILIRDFQEKICGSKVDAGIGGWIRVYSALPWSLRLLVCAAGLRYPDSFCLLVYAAGFRSPDGFLGLPLAFQGQMSL